MEQIPRSEYPRPQFERNNWMNLNGKWQFEIDHGNSGLERGMQKVDYTMSGEITVPFCPESKLSGVEYVDFMEAVWYKRNITLTPEQLKGVVLLHFGAVDYECCVYVNGQEVGKHKGGYGSFSFDITAFVTEGENQITVYAHDDVRSPLQPRGKQSEIFYSHRCDYTRTTGIWQTVWIEFVPTTRVERIKYYPDVENNSVTLFVETIGSGNLDIVVRYEGRVQAEAHAHLSTGQHSFTLPLKEQHLWEVGCGRLYDVKLTYEEDIVNSYFGLRNVRLEDGKFLVNGKSVFQRLVLDQGFYPDGIYTAPTDEELKKDIENSMMLGFNGARLHEKIFEPRFLYWADKLGYLVWEEHANWGFDTTDFAQIRHFLPEWCEAVKRDFNHPSIIGWAPFNETWNLEAKAEQDEILRTVYRATKEIDKTRPVIDVSGLVHAETDIFDVHDYQQNPEIFKANYEDMESGLVKDCLYNHPETPYHNCQKYDGKMPFFVSEYGGILWSDKKDGWGYGDGPKTEEEFIERYKELTESLLDNPNMLGFCYTQLYDVEQEQNGLLTYDRKFKFNPEIIRKINTKKAAIEK